eukprot:TRINITY_DN4034_c0_g1_i4.p1 TRINITY_DN4034_c0_g1~~TRINITY_DN4034_c0_g1_i4.p1  ORF type:complete len:337 (-),score=106.94 TRINITY_DN4034_c0_g1_i4:647-1657(-)
MASSWFSKAASMAQEAAKEAAEKAAEKATKLKDEAAKLKDEAQAAAATAQRHAQRHAAELAQNASALAQGAEKLLQTPSESSQAQKPQVRDVNFEEGPLGFDLEGARIVVVEPESQADRHGLCVGDRLVAVAGETIPPPPSSGSAAEGDVRVRKLIRKWIKERPRPVQLSFEVAAASDAEPTVDRPARPSEPQDPAPRQSEALEVNSASHVDAAGDSWGESLDTGLDFNDGDHEEGWEHDLALKASIGDGQIADGWGQDLDLAIDGGELHREGELSPVCLETVDEGAARCEDPVEAAEKCKKERLAKEAAETAAKAEAKEASEAASKAEEERVKSG